WRDIWQHMNARSTRRVRLQHMLLSKLGVHENRSGARAHVPVMLLASVIQAHDRDLGKPGLVPMHQVVDRANGRARHRVAQVVLRRKDPEVALECMELALHSPKSQRRSTKTSGRNSGS